MAKQKQRKDQGLGSIFDHFAAQGREGYDNPDPARGSRAPVRDEDPRIAELMGKLEKQEAEISALRNQAYAPQAAPIQQQQTQLRDQVVDFTDLPDPMQDLEGFKRGTAERVNAAIQMGTRQVRNEVLQAQNDQQSADAAWNAFTGAYPEWAEYPDLVGTVANQLVEQAKAKGWDTKKYVFSDPTAFNADIAKVLKSQYGALVTNKESDIDPDDHDYEAPGAQSGDYDEDDGRTAGTFGGQESGGKPTEQRRNQDGADMLQDLHALQRKSGFF